MANPLTAISAVKKISPGIVIDPRVSTNSVAFISLPLQRPLLRARGNSRPYSGGATAAASTTATATATATALDALQRAHVSRRFHHVANVALLLKLDALTIRK